jgi:steroid delta-isomerase-like uncharacterized protein
MKKFLLIFPLIVLLCLSFGCRDKDAMAELKGFKARVEVEKQNMALARQYIDTFNRGDFDAFVDLLSPDYAIYNPSGYPEPSSRDKLIENLKGAAQAFSGFTWSVEDMMAAGDRVICRIKVTGTYVGGMPGLPEDAREFEFSLITIMRLEDGKIVEEWQEDDQLGLARQLGMELRPIEEKK